MRRTTHAIPPSMYRHFALITVLVTAALAMFAQGENDKMAQRLATPAAPVAQPSPTLRMATTAQEAGAASSGYEGSDDFGADFGQPMEQLIEGASGIIPEELAQEAGYSSDYLASLSPEERELLLKGLQDEGMLSADIRSSRSDALLAASGRRSGAPEGMD